MITVRQGVFETNSSSTHTMTIRVKIEGGDDYYPDEEKNKERVKKAFELLSTDDVEFIIEDIDYHW